MSWLCLLLLGCREPMAPPTVPVPQAASRAWGELLGEVVQQDGSVDLDHLERERSILDAYVASLAAPGRKGSQAEAARHARWLNAYTALLLHQVLERGRPASVLEVPGWPRPGAGFFYWTEFRVGEDWLSLWELGNERVLQGQQDYRDLGALPVLARTGPPLRAELYTPKRLSRQLDDQFDRFVRSGRAVRIEADRASLNPVFERYAFELDLWTHGRDVCSLLAAHSKGEQRRELLELAHRGCPHDSFAMDWTLDEARR